MRIAMLSPIGRRTPPRHYGPRESLVSLLTESLLRRGVSVTLFATADSATRGTLKSVCPRGCEEDPHLIPNVWECLHISALFEQADEFDLIHNHSGFLPLSYTAMSSTPMLTTIHGVSPLGILPVYEKYNDRGFYASNSDSDRTSALNYLATVYPGIDPGQFTFQAEPGDYLLFLGGIHSDNLVQEAIAIARSAGLRLILAGVIQDRDYYEGHVASELQPGRIEFIGSVGAEQRNRLLGGARALLYPTAFDDLPELAVIESMACGTPVIAFNRGSMPEFVEDGRTGFLVTDADHEVRAIERLAQLNRADCRSRVEQFFTIDRMADEYFQLYQDIIAKSARESHRPWGYYKVLASSKDYKAKEIVVFPGRRLSLQRHRLRTEHWLILEGRATITLNERTTHVGPRQSVDIEKGAIHRIANPSPTKPLRFLEIQTGHYFGEDDIERLEDDYGRE